MPKDKILYFVVGEYPTPEETAEILALAEGDSNVEVMSVQKMPADHVADLTNVSEMAGAVPTLYRAAATGDGPTLHKEYVKPLMTPEAVSAGVTNAESGSIGSEGGADAGGWVPSATAKPETRKRK